MSMPFWEETKEVELPGPMAEVRGYCGYVMVPPPDME